MDELDESAKRYNSVNCVANQNGKLIGAVTHVLVDNPMEGYGISMEKMLAAS